MKISSVSKKVLASALSAAMVVAFAPTVAFGATGDKIEVTTDINGGTGSVPTFSEAVVGGKVALPTDVTFGTAKYALDGWYYDYNEDGKITQGSGDKAWVNTDALPDQESIAFKAYYKVPSITKNDIAYKVVSNTSTGTGTNASTNSYITVPLTVPLDEDKSGFKVSLYGTDGHLLGTTDAFGLPAHAPSAAVQFGTGDSPIDNVGVYKKVSASDITYGTYTIKLTDAENDVISTETLTLYKLVISSKDNGTTKEETKVVAKGDIVRLTGFYKNAAGQIVTGDYTVNGDDTLSSVDTSKGNVYGGEYDEENRSMRFLVSAPTTTNASYVLTVKDPSGTEVYRKNVAPNTGAAAQTFTFNPNATSGDIVSATEAAGTYTATLTQTVKGGNGELDKTSSVSTILALTEVKYEAGDNTSFYDSVQNSAKDKFTDNTETFSVATIGSMVSASSGYTLASAWQLNGKALGGNNKLVAGATNVLVATAEAIDVSKKIATPALESVTKQDGGKYTVKLSCATAGADIYYTTDGTAPSAATATKYDAGKGIKDLAKTATITAIAVPVDGATPAALVEPSLPLTLAPAASDANIAAYKGIAQDGSLEYYVGKTTDKWAAIESIAAAVTAGNEAVDAVVFDTAESLKSLATAQSKAVYDAVLAEAKAQLAVYEGEAYVIVGDKAYTISSKSLKSTKETLAAMEDYITGLGDKATPADYSTAIAKYVTETNKALKAASEADVSAADITAAQDVTAALKAAATAEDAQAAIDAYEALTDDQKALVATADVLAAHAVIDEAEKAAAEEAAKKAEEEAKAAAEAAEKAAAAAFAAQQDKTAVSLVNNPKTKTVKLATAKKAKTTLTYKVKVSASGSLVTYAKVSGNAKITVGAAGKVTLKKVTKAGTYKAKVLVTCGTQTRTVTVKFVVTK